MHARQPRSAGAYKIRSFSVSAFLRKERKGKSPTCAQRCFDFISDNINIQRQSTGDENEQKCKNDETENKSGLFKITQFEIQRRYHREISPTNGAFDVQLKVDSYTACSI